MTTIAYRDGVLAADSLVTSGGIACGHAKKIVVRPDGSAIGLAGGASDIVKASRWFMAGESDDWEGDASALIARPDGSIFEVNDGEVLPIVPIAPGCYAIGSGWIIAMAAMLAGADAVRAVEIARTLDGCTGGDVESVRIGSVVALAA